MESQSFFIIVIIIAVLLSAYFTGSEIAIITFWKMSPGIDLGAKTIPEKIKKEIKSNPEKYIASITVGNYMAFVFIITAVAGLLFTGFDKSSYPLIILLVFTIFIATLLYIIPGKVIPKLLFSLFPARILQHFLVSMLFFNLLFYPFIIIVRSFSKKILPPISERDKITALYNPIINRIGLNWFVDKALNTNEENKESLDTEVKLFRNALDFSKVKLREIMVPRTEIEMMDMNSSIEELRQRFVETGYSRIIFYENNIDNIIGYVHSSVIFKNPDSFKPFINNVLIVPETMPANKLLSTFIREHRSIAIVVDEFGGTSGMVTSEDILEEIFGEIEDEHDTTDIIEKKLSETEYIFSGRSEIDLINEKFRISLPESEDFETLAGFILFHHESIPTINSVIKIGSFHFKILKATNTRIELVKLTINKE